VAFFLILAETVDMFLYRSYKGHNSTPRQQLVISPLARPAILPALEIGLIGQLKGIGKLVPVNIAN
jgi:hypothetical protein